MVYRIQGHHSFVQPVDTPGHRGALFRPGEVFLGQVLECHGTAEVTLAAKGARFRAHTTLPLVPGNRYEFFVQQKQPQLILNVLDLDPSEPSRHLRLWSLHAASRASFARLLQNLISLAETYSDGKTVELALPQLRNLLPSLICSGSDSLNPRWLVQQQSSWGLFWENKVARWLSRQGAGSTAHLVAADLKGTLLGLMKRLEQPDVGGLDPELKAAVAQTLEFVELQQRLNLLGGPEPGQWFWFIPGAEDQGLHSAEVLVEDPGGESGRAGGDGVIRLRMRLELSRLGPMEAAVSLQQEKISCQLIVVEESLVGWIASKLPELNTALEACGFRVGFLGCEAGNIQQLPPVLLAQEAQSSALLYVVI